MKFSIYMIALCTLFLSPFSVFAKTPNDPYFAQWSFEDTGVYKAWDYSTGSREVIVAIVDNGFDTLHPDLRDNIWTNEDEIIDNGIDDDNNGYIDDYYGWNFLDNNNDPRSDVSNLSDAQKQEGVFNHATIVAGIIGAKGNNGLDGAGINWDVRLMNLKVIGNDGFGDFTPLVKAIYYAVDNGAQIINISMVGDGNEESLQKVIDYAYQNNVLVVAAAGNNRIDLNNTSQYPICSDEFLTKDEVLGVSAIDQDHHLAMFSNIGSDCIDITAPGVGIHSTLRFSPTNGLSDSYSVDKGWSGTSFSAPFISGAAALLKSVKIGLSVDTLIKTLLTTVHHTPNEDEVGYANLFGAGLLQVDKAIKSILNTPNTESNITTTTIEIKNDNINSDIFLNNTKVSLISNKTGKKEIINQNGTSILNDVFVGVEDVYTFQDLNGILENVTLSTTKDNKKLIKFYNGKSQFWKQIKIDLVGNYDLAVGNMDVHGITQTVLVLAPQDNNNVYFYIYDLSGNLLQTYHAEARHSGASVDLKNKYIVLAYVENYKTNVKVLNYDFSLQNSFVTSQIEASQVMSFDWNSDDKEEYILSAKAGNQAFLKIFDSKGLELFSTRVYNSQYRGGFHFAIADYDSNGELNFIFTPATKELPLRVVSLSGQFITERFPFANEDYGSIFTFLLKKD